MLFARQKATATSTEIQAGLATQLISRSLLAPKDPLNGASMCFLEFTILQDVSDGDVRINPTMLGAIHILGLQRGTLSLSRVQETYRHEPPPARQIAPSEIGLSALTLEFVKRRLVDRTDPSSG